MDERSEELLTGHALGNLNAADQAAMDELLQAQPQIQQSLADTQEIWALFAHAAPTQEAPLHLKHQILAAAYRQRSKARLALPSPIAAKAGWWHWGAIAALVLLVLGLGWTNYRLQQKLALLDETFVALQTIQPPRESSTPAAVQAFTLKGTPVQKGTPAQHVAIGSIVLKFEDSHALISLRNLPPLSAGERYRLWAFTQDQKVLCGQFNTNAAGQIVTRIPITGADYKSPVRFMRISREPIGNAPKPRPKALVMTSEPTS